MLKGRKVQGWGLRTKLREAIRNQRNDWRHYRPPQVDSNCLKTTARTHFERGLKTTPNSSNHRVWKRRFEVLRLEWNGEIRASNRERSKMGERRKESRGWVKQRGKGTEGKGRENSQTHSSHSPIRSKSDYAAFKRDSDRASKIERVERYRRN